VKFHVKISILYLETYGHFHQKNTSQSKKARRRKTNNPGKNERPSTSTRISQLKRWKSERSSDSKAHEWKRDRVGSEDAARNNPSVFSLPVDLLPAARHPLPLPHSRFSTTTLALSRPLSDPAIRTRTRVGTHLIRGICSWKYQKGNLHKNQTKLF